MLRRVGYTAAVTLCCAFTTAWAAVPVRVATFNIEFFDPANPTQFNATRDILIRIGADVVCVMEISSSADLAQLASAAGYPYSDLAHDTGAIDGTLHVGVLSKHPFTSVGTETSATLSGDPTARDLTRNFSEAVVDIPGAARDVVMIANHWKSGTTDEDEFRRSIESIRAMQVTADYDSSVVPYFVVGDMNDDISDSPDSPAQFESLPGGLPVSFDLGDDITFPVANGVFLPLQAGTGTQDLTVVNALQKDGSDATRRASGRRLDYIWRSNGMTVVGSEVYDSQDEGLPGGRPKYGSPLPYGTSDAASDHMLVFMDITLPDGTGACCISGNCSMLTEAQCLDQSGIFRGVDVVCGQEIPACSPGVCCLSGTCNDTLDETRCLAQGGSFRGLGLTCGQESPPCSAGACCNGAACDDTLTASQCIGQGGAFRGAGVACGTEQPPCGNGACCVGGGCDDTIAESQCLAQSGEFRGIGVVCGQENPPCPGPVVGTIINEVLITHTGTVQDKEFVELLGQPYGSLAGLTLLAIEGDGTISRGRVDLAVSLNDCGGGTPCALDGNGYFVAGGSGISPNLLISPGTYLFEDGTQTIVLVRDCTVVYGNDVDLDDDGVAEVNVGTVEDAVGVVDTGYPAGDAVYFSAPAIGPDGTLVAAGADRCRNTRSAVAWELLSRATDGSDGRTPITPHQVNPGCGGDYDGDGRVDLFDFSFFQACFSPGVTASAACWAGEMDADGDIDLNDLALFIGQLAGP